MAYDPKKKRPKQKSLDSVVDEIFGEEQPETKPAKAKTSSKVTPITKKSETKKSAADAKKPSTSKKSSTSKVKSEPKVVNPEPIDNVTPLHPESQETPLIMQPQVWVATGIAALIVLMVARKRRRK